MIYFRSTLVGLVAMLVSCGAFLYGLAIRRLYSMPSPANGTEIAIWSPVAAKPLLHLIERHPAFLVVAFLGFVLGFLLAYRSYSRFSATHAAPSR
jgi:hypothetical protein